MGLKEKIIVNGANRFNRLFSYQSAARVFRPKTNCISSNPSINILSMFPKQGQVTSSKLANELKVSVTCHFLEMH